MFIVSIFNMLTLTYYLAIEQYDFLTELFPSFTTYVLIFSLIAAPTLIIVGYFHMHRRAYRDEVEVETKSNPYRYKLPPGIMQEVVAPLLLELIRLIRKNESEKLSDDETTRLIELDSRLGKLVDGGMLDKPKNFGGL